MTITHFIIARQLEPSTPTDLASGVRSKLSGFDHLEPSYLGKNKDGSISVALFAQEKRYVVIWKIPEVIIEGVIGEGSKALDVVF